MQHAASAEYRRRGTIATAEVDGALYRIGAREYVLTDRDEVFVLRRGRAYRVRNAVMIARVLADVEADFEIAAARCALAAERAHGDELLAIAIRTHLEYTGGRLDAPEVVDGIAFYAVGRNASHEFAIGTKDGKCYVRSSGEEFLTAEDAAAMDPEALAAIRRDRLIVEDADGIFFAESRVREVAPGWQGCYLGHH